jgi:hypothetical protein
MYIQDINIEELEEILPKSLTNWNQHHLEKTYEYCRSNSLKNMINCEYWWRNELCVLKTTH